MSNLALVQNETVPCVYAAIAAVASDIARTGIAKDRKNEQQGYKFRGIDEVFNALSPLLAKHRLIILPRVLSRTQTERTTQKGGVLFTVIVDAEFDFVSAADGSRHTVRTFGEGMDSADKATNKAMSAAYKYAAFQTFCIPLEGAMDDADRDHHDVAPATVNKRTGEEYPPPDGYGKWIDEMQSVADCGTAELTKAFKEAPEVFQKYLAEIDRKTGADLKDRARKVKAS